MYNLTLIAALDYAGAIGRGNTIPWKLRDDMKHFQDTTKGSIVVMGRPTFESLPDQYKPLPERENWVLSRNTSFMAPGCRTIRRPEQVFEMAQRREIFVMGGGMVYDLFMPNATRLLITHVEAEVEKPDAFFPELPKEWVQTRLAGFRANDRNQFAFTIVEYLEPRFAEERRRDEHATELPAVR